MSHQQLDNQDADLTIEHNTIACHGDWTLPHLKYASEKLAALPGPITAPITIEGQHITAMDSAGAWILCELQQQLSAKNQKISFSGFSKEHQSLLELVRSELEKISQPISPPKPANWVVRIGKNTVLRYRQALEFITFIGEILHTLWDTIRHPQRWQWRAFLNVIDETGFQALAIVGLLAFLIGIVLSYQAAQQLKLYGANVYIVPILGIAVLQEFAPLITAIIVAGRTSSAFTAQIGSMQVNAEIDALRTMGFSPITRLVIPKIFGLLIAMPLLFIWADIFGLLGGIMVSKHMLNIGLYGFIQQFNKVIQLSTLLNGLIKAPVFAAIIAVVGCFHGFKVSSTADSVGRETTKSVVKAIFLIIIADAIFSIILPWQTF